VSKRNKAGRRGGQGDGERGAYEKDTFAEYRRRWVGAN
jgi:hypothetical protein